MKDLEKMGIKFDDLAKFSAYGLGTLTRSDGLVALTSKYIMKEPVADTVAPFIDVTKTQGSTMSLSDDELGQYDDLVPIDDYPNPVVLSTEAGVNYALKSRGLMASIPVVVAKDNDLADLQQLATLQMQRALTVSRERRVAKIFNTSGNFAAANYTALVGTQQWNNQGTGESSLKTDLRTAINAVDGANAIILPKKVRTWVVTHPDVNNISGWTAWTAQYGLEKALDLLFMNEFGISNIIRADMVWKSSRKNATRVTAPIWGNHAVVLALPGVTNGMLLDPMFCGTFKRKGKQLEVKVGMVSDVGEEGAYRVMVRMPAHDEVIIDNTCAYLIYNAISPDV